MVLVGVRGTWVLHLAIGAQMFAAVHATMDMGIQVGPFPLVDAYILVVAVRIVAVVGGMIGVVEKLKQALHVQLINGYTIELVHQISVKQRINVSMILPVSFPPPAL